MNSLYVLSIVDTLNEWTEKLNAFTASHMDNVWTGAAIFGIILFVAIWGVRTLNKK